MRDVDYSVYLVTDHGVAARHPTLSFVQIVEAALRGGVTCVQLRMKQAAASDVLAQARELQPIVAAHDAAFIINDHVSVAKEVGADGVHIGQDDMPIVHAREILGPNTIIGVSAQTIQHAVDAQLAGADYVGVGPVFATKTKTDAVPPIGADVLADICAAVSVPVVAIGGIKLINAKRVVECGADGLAMISAIMAESNPQHPASQFAQIVATTQSQAKKMEGAA